MVSTQAADPSPFGSPTQSTPPLASELLPLVGHLLQTKHALGSARTLVMQALNKLIGGTSGRSDNHLHSLLVTTLDLRSTIIESFTLLGT